MPVPSTFDLSMAHQSSLHLCAPSPLRRREVRVVGVSPICQITYRTCQWRVYFWQIVRSWMSSSTPSAACFSTWTSTFTFNMQWPVCLLNFLPQSCCSGLLVLFVFARLSFGSGLTNVQFSISQLRWSSLLSAHGITGGDRCALHDGMLWRGFGHGRHRAVRQGSSKIYF